MLAPSRERRCSLWGRSFAAGYTRPSRAWRPASWATYDGAACRARARGARDRLPARASILQHYPPADDEPVCTEPEGAEDGRRSRPTPSRLNVSVVETPAEKLPSEDDSLRYAPSPRWKPCTVINLAPPLDEGARVLEAGWAADLPELHVRRYRAGWPGGRDRLHLASAEAGHGCHCNRATLEAARESSPLRLESHSAARDHPTPRLRSSRPLLTEASWRCRAPRLRIRPLRGRASCSEARARAGAA